MSIEFFQCPRSYQAAALLLLSNGVGSTQGVESQCVAAESEPDFGGDWRGIWIATWGGRLVGAILTQQDSVRRVTFWAPVIDAEVVDRSELAQGLLKRALAFWGGQGVTLAYALELSQGGSGGLIELERAGFRRVTDVLSLSRRRGASNASDENPARLVWEEWAASNASDFVRLIEECLESKADLPELHGEHNSLDLIDPEGAEMTRLLGRLGGEPAAVALIRSGVVTGTMDLRYIGVARALRGQGLGREALARAVSVAEARGCGLEVVVDSRNIAAERMYNRAGFVLRETRVLSIKSFSDREMRNAGFDS